MSNELNTTENNTTNELKVPAFKHSDVGGYFEDEVDRWAEETIAVTKSLANDRNAIHAELLKEREKVALLESTTPTGSGPDLSSLIESHNKALAEAQDRVSQLTKELDAKNATILSLEGKVAEQQALITMNPDENEKAIELEAFKTRCTELENKVNEIEDDYKTKEANYQTAMTTKEEQLDALRSHVSSMEHKIEEVEKMDLIIKKKDTKIQQVEGLVNLSNNHIKELENHVAELNACIDERDAQVADLVKQVKELSTDKESYDQMKEDVKNIRNELASKSSELNEEKAKTEELNLQLATVKVEASKVADVSVSESKRQLALQEKRTNQLKREEAKIAKGLKKSLAVLSGKSQPNSTEYNKAEQDDEQNFVTPVFNKLNRQPVQIVFEEETEAKEYTPEKVVYSMNPSPIKMPIVLKDGNTQLESSSLLKKSKSIIS